MSGGEFNYDEYRISQIADSIEQFIINNDSTDTNEWGETKGHNYSPEVIAEFKTAVTILRTAFIYAHRVDYLISGDDGEDSFLSRLEDERKIYD